MRIGVAYGDAVDPILFRRCPRCGGSGDEVIGGGVLKTCAYCGGSGERYRSYSYESDLPVAVGDVVRVPGNWHKPESQLATVVTLSPELYDGPVSRILEVVERRSS